MAEQTAAAAAAPAAPAAADSGPDSGSGSGPGSGPGPGGPAPRPPSAVQPVDFGAEDSGEEKKEPLIDTKMWLIIFGGILVLMLFFTLPTVIIMGVGMLPGVVAAVVDRSEARHAAYSVIALNICGVFPFILSTWTGDHSAAQALNVVTSAFALTVMYSAAGLGWLLYAAVPPVIAQFLSVLAQRRVDTLHNQQRAIIEAWGPDAAAGADISHLEIIPEGGEDTDEDRDDIGGLAPPPNAAAGR